MGFSLCVNVWERERQKRLTFLWWSDCDGLGCELLIKVSGVCLRRHLRLEGRDQLRARREDGIKGKDETSHNKAGCCCVKLQSSGLKDVKLWMPRRFRQFGLNG